MNPTVFPYIITVSSEKGGVGKTTLATNLAVFLKALDEELPVSIVSLDNHFTIDKMFAFPGQKSHGTVADLLMEVPGSQLLLPGQYGVSYIPSCADLADIRFSIKNPMLLSRLIAYSNIPGVLIIDTRPDLDILTQNALYAADKVIIPVKDMASMENCRNIFALFDKRGLDKSSLSLIPCLVDERIKYEGPFRDLKSLIRAFTINRGYRSFDTIISKSPKVESLNTNPDGKVYPILTHARGTEVHSQFYRLSNEILRDIRKGGDRRSYLFYQWVTAENERKKEAFHARMSGVNGHCLGCGNSVNTGGNPPLSYYCESDDTRIRGYMEEGCMVEILRRHVYRLPDYLSPEDPTVQLLLESARESSFILRRVGAYFSFHRFDLKGTLITSKDITPDQSSPLARLADTLTLSGSDDAFIILHPVDPDAPHAILNEEPYRGFSRLKRIIGDQLSPPVP